MTYNDARPPSRWELRSCARHGHETYKPTDQGDELTARLRAQSAAGEAWRCLRCGDFVLGAPRRSGPAENAPLVLRGKTLRQAVILRVLAVERGIRGILLAAAAYAVHRFQTEQGALRKLFERDLPALRQLGIDVDSSAVVRTLRHALALRSSTLSTLALLMVAYATIELVEAVGLWLLTRWGEYTTVVATGAFIPFEVYELTHRTTFIKVGALIINVAAVVYLIVAKRLFGARGGAAAADDERHHEAILEVERAAQGG